MVITYHGHQFFKIQYGDVTIALDPPSSSSEFKSARFGADIVLTSLNHEDYNGGDGLTAGDKDPFVISGPGEYEVQEIFITGLPSKSNYKGEERINTIYYFNLENMDVLHLGALGDTDLSSETLEAIDNVDILFIPIGEEGVLDPVEAHKLGVKLEASIIIPMHYTNTQLDVFLKEEGGEKKKASDKLTLKPKDVAEEEGSIMVLEKSN